MTIAPDRNLDADLRAIAIPCPACLMPAGKPCHFANGADPARWIHAERGLAFWRRPVAPLEAL